GKGVEVDPGLGGAQQVLRGGRHADVEGVDGLLVPAAEEAPDDGEQGQCQEDDQAGDGGPVAQEAPQDDPRLADHDVVVAGLCFVDQGGRVDRVEVGHDYCT